MPWDKAFGGDGVQREAAAIIFQEFEGREFDMEKWCWKKT